MILDKILAIDVSKDVLDAYDGEKLVHLANKKENIGSLLRAQKPGTLVVMEPTNHYHELLAGLAYESGFTVYLLNPRGSHHYMNFLDEEVRDDRSAAKALHRLATKELDRFRPWKPMSPDLRELDSLVKARALQVRMQEALIKSNRDLSRYGNLILPNDRLLATLTTQIARFDKEIERKAKKFQIYKWIVSCPGVGPVVGSALTLHFLRYDFANADQLVNSIGLSVKKRRSGKGPEIRYLTKQGPGYLRALVYICGRASSTTRLFRDDYAALRRRGLDPTEAFLTLGRRVLRIVFAVVRDQKKFDPAVLKEARKKRLSKAKPASIKQQAS